MQSTAATLPPQGRSLDPETRLAFQDVLAAARIAFQAALEGLCEGPLGEEALALSEAEQRARSLRELWHLRGALYTLIARGLGEFEARRRLARLDLAFSAARQ
ncbi:MAG: hypothetical protein JO369_08375 [Paucibacter sp.]|nr:hypothetical protein [Roseateles sp.]